MFFMMVVVCEQTCAGLDEVGASVFNHDKAPRLWVTCRVCSFKTRCRRSVAPILVAAAILAAVEGDILPPGRRFGKSWDLGCSRSCPAGRDARLYGRRDARRHAEQHADLEIGAPIAAVPHCGGFIKQRPLSP